MERSGKALLCLALLVASTQCTKADIGGFFSDLGNSLKDAGNTIKGGTETAFQVVKNNTVDAANATGKLLLPVHLYTFFLHTRIFTLCSICGKRLLFLRAAQSSLACTSDTCSASVHICSRSNEACALHHALVLWQCTIAQMAPTAMVRGVLGAMQRLEG